MTSRSLRALGVFPCGACRALVPADKGCPHRKVRRQTGRQRTRSPLESGLAMAKLQESGAPRHILAAAALSPSGTADVGGDRARRQAASRLAARGLLVREAPRSSRYAITDEGRKVYAKLRDMDAGQF